MAKILYARTEEDWRRGQKYAFLDEKQHVGNIEWQELQPDAKHNWLTSGMQVEFDTFLPLGQKEAKQSRNIKSKSLFQTFGPGTNTSRDVIVYDYNEEALLEKVRKFSESYNAEVDRFTRSGKPKDIDDFINYESVKWSAHLKNKLASQKIVMFDACKVIKALYRPFTTALLYADETLVDRLGLQKNIFPPATTGLENQAICVAGVGDRKGFGCLLTQYTPSYDLAFEKAQYFPFYTYDEDGTNRRENVTDWALEKFRGRYGDENISKWDIFHYVYAVLHHPAYRERYAANLKRELPRVPFAPDFRAFAEAGARLAELHVNYESQPECPLERIEAPGVPLNWRVERMRLSKDKRSLVYNEFLTLSGIPPEVFEYRLGNRSALEWVVDQYRVTTDPRSRIANDPNRPDDPQYILRLVGQVITVSLETVAAVRALPSLGLPA